jgi:hypothetical protein
MCRAIGENVYDRPVAGDQTVEEEFVTGMSDE